MSDNLPNDFQGSIAPTNWVSSGEPDSAIVSGIAAAVLACQQAAASATAAAAQCAQILATIQAANYPGGGGTDPTPPATTGIQGKVKLAGDLGGTADLPTVPALSGGTTAQYFRGDKTWRTLATDAATPASVTTVAADLAALTATVNALPSPATLATVGNVVRLFGDVPRRVGGVIGGALLPAAPATCVDWRTVNATLPPTAFDVNGDNWENVRTV